MARNLRPVLRDYPEVGRVGPSLVEIMDTVDQTRRREVEGRHFLFLISSSELLERRGEPVTCNLDLVLVKIVQYSANVKHCYHQHLETLI